MIPLGKVDPGSVLYIPFDSFAGSTGASSAISGLAVTDIEVYKNGGTTQRGSDNGYALLDTDGIDFDGITGINGFSIDLADNSTAGFWEAGAKYFVVVSAITVDSQTVNFLAATFEIGYQAAVLNTSIATLSSQTSFTLTDGPAEDDALNGMWALIHDVASKVQKSWVQILDYTGSTKTVTLAAGATFTAAATDSFSVFGPMPLQPSVTARQIVVESDGMGHADVKEWLGTAPLALSSQQVQAVVPTTQKVDVETIKTNPVVNGGTITFPTNATVASSADVTAVETDTQDIQSRLPAALTGDGNIKADTLRVNGTAQTAGDLAGLLATLAAYVDTEVAAIKAKTDNLPTDPADASDIASSFTSLASTLSTIAGYLDTEVAAILADTNELQTDLANGGRLDLLIDAILADTGTDGVVLSSATYNAIADAILARSLGTEAVSADGAVPTVAQAFFEMLSLLGEFSISGTTVTCKKRDGTTTLFTSTLDSSTPTSRTRAT